MYTVTISTERHAELIAAERDAMLLKRLLEQKAAHFCGITATELCDLKELFSPSAESETKE